MHQKYLPTAKTEVVMHYHLWPPSVLYATQGGSNATKVSAHHQNKERNRDLLFTPAKGGVSVQDSTFGHNATQDF